MKILLTNDDGIHGEGLWAVARALKNRGFDVAIAAPMNQQSGMSHALSVLREIEYKNFDNPDFEAWTFNGTPTDCVKIYLEGMTDKKFDAVISGINDGSNLATDILYSGTIGAALEGFLHSIPSLAVSRDRESEISFDTAAEVTADYLEKILAIKRKAFLHNINFPKKFRTGKAEFASTRPGQRDYINAFTSRTDHEGRAYFRIGGTIYDVDAGEGTDIHAVNCGYVSVTPLSSDTADYESIIELRRIFRG
ncbi:MAG: 5'/3'-nucleotidase SurE [Selenomonadaceae bacterium]|nr:5'/3'-nucleotidase SurE [Selenomonadaceae bacterium]MBR4383567.1 5'/3'-nucleotidase SurE [Selenomonadaceae bacterium]